MRLLRIPVLVLALVLLVPAAAAVGKLPTTKNKTIVPGKSLSGLALGESKARVDKLFGPNGYAPDLGGVTTAIWEPQDTDLNYYAGTLSVSVKGGKVQAIAVRAAKDTRDRNLPPTYGGPMAKYKTDSKPAIGIGSSLAKLKQAFPKAKRVGVPTQGYSSYQVAGKGKKVTNFGLYAGNGGPRVYFVEVERK